MEALVTFYADIISLEKLLDLSSQFMLSFQTKYFNISLYTVNHMYIKNIEYALFIFSLSAFKIEADSQYMWFFFSLTYLNAVGSLIANGNPPPGRGLLYYIY